MDSDDQREISHSTELMNEWTLWPIGKEEVTVQAALGCVNGTAWAPWATGIKL